MDQRSKRADVLPAIYEERPRKTVRGTRCRRGDRRHARGWHWRL